MKSKSFKRKYPNSPFYIAGPCSAETEAQVMSTARELAKQKIELFRAGVWKPRTLPNSFEGVGVKGLRWLKQVKEETGLKVCTEVANTAQVFSALKYDMDAIWIGARSTTSPFTVQEIADAIEGIDIPVIIKNPINPDLKLWKGAIERIYKSGVTNIILVHRGFSSLAKTPHRNIPYWQIPENIKKEFPNLILLNDNSHICGKRDTLAEIAQEAFNNNQDGLMTEVHINPEKAWTDAAQQITPEAFKKLTSSLRFNKDLKTHNLSQVEI